MVKEFGTLDIVINNAGITRDGLLMRMTEENFNEVVRTNLNSVFNITKACQRPMLKQRSGSIINISSVVGVKGNAGQANEFTGTETSNRTPAQMIIQSITRQ